MIDATPIQIVGPHAIARLKVHGYVIVRQADLDNMTDAIGRLPLEIVERVTEELGKRRLASARDAQPREGSAV